jgi:hypothetical protein
MKIYEEKPVTKIERTLTKIVCDRCKKEIEKEKHYYEVTTEHEDWGSESIESIDDKDICSDECLQKEFESYLEFKSNTKQIRIERR